MTSVAAESGAGASRARVMWFAIAVAIIAIAPFLPALNADFVTWDDDRNFIRNPSYRGLGISQLKWMWTTFHMGHYVPLSWMTLGLDYVLWGMNARGYHLTSIVIHGANAVAIFFVSRRVLGSAFAVDRDRKDVLLGAAIAALLFAIHPLRAESVAWVTERRDVLSGLFYSLTVLFYLRAVEHTPVSQRQYAVVFALFFAALLSKATAMTLPAVLLILNVYPLRRLTRGAGFGSSARQITMELAPLFMLSVAAMLMSLRALPHRDQLGVAEKAAVSAFSFVFYLVKTLVPAGLGPLYQMPARIPFASGAYLASYALVAGIALLLALQWARWPGITAATVSYIVIVLPMLGIVQNGPQITADRYTYHAAPALALLAGAAFVLAWRKRPAAAVGSGALVLAALAPVTWVQTGYWHSSSTLWNRAVLASDNSALAHDALGTVFFLQDSVNKALEQYRRAAELNPYYSDVRINIGVSLARLGRFDEANQYFQKALDLQPESDRAENSWGVMLARQNNLPAAIAHFRLALQYNPDNGDAELNLGNALVSSGMLTAALPHYARAASLNQLSADVEAHWGAALAQMGRLDDAFPHFVRAVALDPSDARAKKLLDRATSERAAKMPGKSQ